MFDVSYLFEYCGPSWDFHRHNTNLRCSLDETDASEHRGEFREAILKGEPFLLFSFVLSFKCSIWNQKNIYVKDFEIMFSGGAWDLARIRKWLRPPTCWWNSWIAVIIFVLTFKFNVLFFWMFFGLVLDRLVKLNAYWAALMI